MIRLEKLVAMLKAKGVNYYTIKKHRIIGTATFKKIMEGDGNIDMRTLNSLCKYLDCQPGDLLEYVPDDVEVAETAEDSCVIINTDGHTQV